MHDDRVWCVPSACVSARLAACLRRLHRSDIPTVALRDGRAGSGPPFTVSATPPAGAAHS
ncbi:hypothetical protein EGY31_11255 [Burkholderia multivorans]|nr:hypothetical protein EGY31_11255 [Burkholderia multivorans]